MLTKTGIPEMNTGVSKSNASKRAGQMQVRPSLFVTGIKHGSKKEENRPNFPTIKGCRMNISMKLVYEYMTIFFTFTPTLNHLHSLHVENCDSNSRLVVDEDDNVKSGFMLPERYLSGFKQMSDEINSLKFLKCFVVDA